MVAPARALVRAYWIDVLSWLQPGGCLLPILGDHGQQQYLERGYHRWGQDGG